MAILDYRNPDELEEVRLPDWARLYLICIPGFGLLYVIICVSWGIHAVQYAGGNPVATREMDLVGEMLGFPMFTFIQNSAGWGIVLWLLNALFWGLAPAIICHGIWLFAVKLGKYT